MNLTLIFYVKWVLLDLLRYLFQKIEVLKYNTYLSYRVNALLKEMVKNATNVTSNANLQSAF